MKKILFAAAILAFGFTTASAQYDSRHADRDRNHNEYRDDRRGGHMSDINFLQREARQQIATGVQRGTLTSREANALMNEYDRIEARERRYSHRGRVSPREARVLREDLERLMANTRRMSDRRGDHWARDRRYRN
jgi:hypothetical protein